MVPNERSDVLKELSSYGVMINSGTNTRALKSKLSVLKKEGHPVINKLDHLTNDMVRAVKERIGLRVKHRCPKKLRVTIKNYLFREFPEKPLTKLEEFLLAQPPAKAKPTSIVKKFNGILLDNKIGSNKCYINVNVNG